MSNNLEYATTGKTNIKTKCRCKFTRPDFCLLKKIIQNGSEVIGTGTFQRKFSER